MASVGDICDGICHECEQPFEYPIKRGTHGRIYCDGCQIIRDRKRKQEWAERNREYNRARGRVYQAKRREDPAYKEQQRERMQRLRTEAPKTLSEINKRSYLKHGDQRRAGRKDYYALNAERERERGREAYAKDPRRYIEYTKQWCLDNPEKARRNRTNGSSRYRARQRSAAVIEKVDRFLVYDRDRGRCHLCGGMVSRDDFHIDHLIPISRGGNHSYDNVATAHPHCNMSRQAGRLPAQLRLVG